MSQAQLKADVAILGGGAAGLSLAAGAAMFGLKVVLFEPNAMGGECLNSGCVPSKAILSAAAAAHTVRTAGRLGVHAGEPEIDFKAVMDHVRAAITAIEPHDSQERFEGLGVTVIREYAQFDGPRSIASDSARVRFRYGAIATGSEPAVPPIPGLAETSHLTNENLWSLTELPKRLAIIGAGAIGCEMAQAFTRLGSAVTLIEAQNEIVAGAAPDHAGILRETLAAEGVDIRTNARASGVAAHQAGVAISLEGEDAPILADHVLVATGRKIRTENLGLNKAGVAVEKGRIIVNDKLRTSNARIFALGDSAGAPMLTHAAGWHASVAVRQIAFRASAKVSSAAIPRVVYTEPELASVGLSEAEAREKHGDKVRVASWKFDHNDRAIAEGRIEGEARIIAKGGTLLGCEIVGEGAGEAIAVAGQCLAQGGKLAPLASMIASYPTRAEIVKRAAGAWYQPVVFGDAAKTLVGLLAKLP